MDDIIVVGAGLAGLFSAIELSRHFKVTLLEAESQVIPTSSSSYNQCYKLHTGMHYIGDEHTAIQCLEQSIKFAKAYPNAVADKNNLKAPWRRGRHYVLDKSYVSPDKARNIASLLSKHYKALVEQDPKNQVFGPPESFIEELDESQYEFLSDAIPAYDASDEPGSTKVAAAFETAESQIDIERLREDLEKEIADNPNITFLPNTKVTNIARTPDSIGVEVSTVSNKKKQSFRSRAIVNCAWQNIEKLDKTSGNFVPDEKKVNRVKVSVLVELPDELKNLNTCIFSLGPFYSITVLPGGQAILTSERFTNVDFYQQGSATPQQLKELLSEKITLDSLYGSNLAEKIIYDCSECFNGKTQELFKKCIPKELHVGFVKITETKKQYDSTSIYEKDSPITARSFDGVEHKSVGVVSNSAMKMTYAVGNAQKVCAIIQDDLNLTRQIEVVIQKAQQELARQFDAKIIAPLLHITFIDRMVELLKNNTNPIDVSGVIVKEASKVLGIKKLTTSRLNAFFKENKMPLKTSEQKDTPGIPK